MKKVSFSKAISNGYMEKFIVGCATAHPVSGLLIDERIDDDTIPKKYRAYYIRHDDAGKICTLETNHVIANYYGAFITDITQKINFNHKEYRKVFNEAHVWIGDELIFEYKNFRGRFNYDYGDGMPFNNEEKEAIKNGTFIFNPQPD